MRCGKILKACFASKKDGKVIQLNNELRAITQGNLDVYKNYHRLKLIFDILDNIDSSTPSATPSLLTVWATKQHKSFQNQTSHGVFNHRSGQNGGRARTQQS